MRQSCSIVQNLVINYHLVVSYPHQCHIGINVSHWYVIIIAIHISLLFVFSRAEDWIIFYKLLVIIVICNDQNKIIDLMNNVMSKRHSIFNENFTIFFSNAGKTGKRAGIQICTFQKIIFMRWYECNIYIVTTSALDFKQLYIIYKFYPIKRIFLSARIPYFAQTFNSSSQM